MVVALAWVLRHVLEMGDEGAIGASRHRGLVHVQGATKSRLELTPVDIAVLKPEIALLVRGLVDRCFVAADRWIEALHVRGRKQLGLPRRSGPGKPSAMRHSRHG